MLSISGAYGFDYTPKTQMFSQVGCAFIQMRPAKRLSRQSCPTPSHIASVRFLTFGVETPINATVLPLDISAPDLDIDGVFQQSPLQIGTPQERVHPNEAKV